MFTGDFSVITEFGRSVCAKVGFTVMQVEYTKQSGGKNFAVVQAGTDLFIRTIYQYVIIPYFIRKKTLIYFCVILALINGH